MQLQAAALAAGVPVPRHALLRSPDDARAYARENGLPLVLKAPHGFSGDGVAVCRGDDALVIALSHWEKLLAQQPQLRGRARLAQRSSRDERVSRTSVAWHRAELAGTTRDKLVRNPAATGPATVVRYRHDATIAGHSAAPVSCRRAVGRYGVDECDGRSRSRRPARSSSTFALASSRR